MPYPEHMQSKLLYTSALDERNNLQGVPTAWDPRYRPSHTGADARVYKRWNSFVYDRGELREDDTGKWGVGVYIYIYKGEAYGDVNSDKYRDQPP